MGFKPSLPNITSIEDVLCKMLETSYNTSVSLADTAAHILMTPMRKVKDFTKRATSIINAQSAIADSIEDLINELFKTLNKKNKKESDFCSVLFQCEAMLELCVDLGLISESQKTDYDAINRLVCKGGLNRLVSNFLDAQVDAITTQLEAIRTIINTNLNTTFGLLLAGYSKVIEDSGIGEVMSGFSKFSNCVFAACDVEESAQNKLEDLQETLYLDSNGEVNSSAFLDEFRDARDALNERINELESLLDLLRVETQKTLSVDNVMKNF